MNSAAHERAAAITRQVLEAWKPYAWGTAVAPRVDLTDDIHAVTEHWTEIRSPDDAARIVAEVLATAHPERREQFDRYTCTSVGAMLFRELHAAGLAPPHAG